MSNRMELCLWCWARIDFFHVLQHAEWHRAHNLHGSDCDVLNSTNKPSVFPTPWFPPLPCTCGLIEKAETPKSSG